MKNSFRVYKSLLLQNLEISDSFPKIMSLKKKKTTKKTARNLQFAFFPQKRTTKTQFVNRGNRLGVLRLKKACGGEKVKVGWTAPPPPAGGFPPVSHPPGCMGSLEGGGGPDPPSQHRGGGRTRPPPAHLKTEGGPGIFGFFGRAKGQIPGQIWSTITDFPVIIIQKCSF